MLKTVIIFLTILGLLQLSIGATSYGACITPKNETSLCIELNDCKSIYNILHTKLSSVEREFLKQSQCGYKDEIVLVCCPPERTTTNRNLLLPQPPNCGSFLGFRIVGGTATSIDEYPWMALIEYTKSETIKTIECVGSLINNRYVITAAHCVLRASKIITAVRLGEWDLRTNPDCETDRRGQKNCAPKYIHANVERVIAHPQYNTDTNEYDVALLRLAESITMNDFVMPICLPFDPQLRNGIFTNRKMDISGWGFTEHKRSSDIKLKASVIVWDFELCKAKYKTRQIALQSSLMCAGGESGIDTCSGDSGGALVSSENSKGRDSFFLFGIVSFGYPPCGLDGWPGVYSRVSEHLDWIEDNVKT